MITVAEAQGKGLYPRSPSPRSADFIDPPGSTCSLRNVAQFHMAFAWSNLSRVSESLEPVLWSRHRSTGS